MLAVGKKTKQGRTEQVSLLQISRVFYGLITLMGLLFIRMDLNEVPLNGYVFNRFKGGTALKK